MLKFLIINGPNINMLGLREPDIYGTENYRSLQQFIYHCCVQEDIEPVVDRIQAAYGDADGIVINPAAYTHTSVAILDALKAVRIPAVEVHLSDISARESFRRISYPGMACLKTFAGLGFEGYREAILFLKDYLEKNNPSA